MQLLIGAQREKFQLKTSHPVFVSPRIVFTYQKIRIKSSFNAPHIVVCIKMLFVHGPIKFHKNKITPKQKTNSSQFHIPENPF